jgi:hypothetical protein
MIKNGGSSKNSWKSSKKYLKVKKLQQDNPIYVTKLTLIFYTFGFKNKHAGISINKILTLHF